MSQPGPEYLLRSLHRRPGCRHGAGSGTVFVTVGTGGVGLYEVNDGDSEARYFATWSGKNRDPALGTLDLTATAGRLSARFVPANGYTFTDAFTIERK